MLQNIIYALSVKSSNNDVPTGFVGKVEALEVSKGERVVISMIVDGCRHADAAIGIFVGHEVAEVVEIWVY